MGTLRLRRLVTSSGAPICRRRVRHDIIILTKLCDVVAEFYEAARLRLGHDPLREDADAQALWEKVRASKKPVGGILMDQTMIAGVGNIYRAEILFKVHACRGRRSLCRNRQAVPHGG